jgi:hypothetical protein
MKTFLYKIVLITIVFALTNFLYIEVLKKTDWSLSKVYKILHFEDKDFDYLFLGASLTLDGIDAQYLTNKGIDSYNFGTQGTSIRSSYIQLNHYLKNNKKPEVVLLGVGSLSKSYKDYNNEFTISVPYQYFYFDNKLSFENLPMVKFRGLAIENLKQVVSKEHREAEFVRGQLRIKKKVPDNTKYKQKLDSEIHVSYYEGASHLFKIDSVCKKNDIKFLVLEMPGFKKTQNLIPVGPHKLWDETHDTIVLYNLNNKDLVSELIDSKNDWLGNSHLNQYGAKKLTKYIYDTILKE